MQRLFAVIFLVLTTASFGVRQVAPDLSSDVPILYWVTDWYPERHEQVQQFRDWMIRNRHVTSQGKPAMDLRIDASNRDVTKLVIQGAAGVCGDILDLPDGTGVRYLQQGGMLEDLTDDAKVHGFDPSQTYSVLESEICFDDRQYAYPRQAYAFMYVANLDTFRRFGMGKPPVRWSIEEFERIGKQFVAAANPPGTRRSIFFANEVRAMTLWRSFGACEFNETLTRCALDHPGYIRSLELMRKWAEVDHLLPTITDLKSIANQTDTQFGDSRLHLFAEGRYAMIGMGRHALPLLRRFGSFQLGAAEPPHGGFPNTFAGTAAVGIYAGSKHKDLARLFLEFVASREFSHELVLSGDGLPPDRRSTTQPDFLHPPNFPNEWGAHGDFADAMNIAIGGAYSPFVLPMRVYEIEMVAREGYTSGIWSAQAAADRVVREVNREIDRSIQGNEDRRKQHAELLLIQAKIDQHRAQGRRVPLSWISNPFHRVYYQHMGWAE